MSGGGSGGDVYDIASARDGKGAGGGSEGGGAAKTTNSEDVLRYVQKTKW